MRALSRRAAQRCEDAQEPACKCRCGGALHGAKRGGVTSLPLTDPHSPARPCPRCRGDGKIVYAYGGETTSTPCGRCGGAGRIIKEVGQ